MERNSDLTLVAFAAKTAGVTVEQAEAVLETVVANLGWHQIHAMQEELRRGQDIYEDAGGYFLRAYRRLFGLSRANTAVVNYRAAVAAMLDATE